MNPVRRLSRLEDIAGAREWVERATVEFDELAKERGPLVKGTQL